MVRTIASAAFAATLLASTGLASADPVKIGFVSTLSGPSAALGVHMRDGFQLAVKELGGKLGGQPTEVIVVDDELKPDVAVTKVKALLERDRVDVVAGVVFSNVMMAISKPVFEAETFLVSGNAGPSPLAGAGCSPFFFSASYQNDQNHETMGAYAQSRGFKKVVLMTPNYQAGKDSMAGFKRAYKGEVVEEIDLRRASGAADYDAVVDGSVSRLRPVVLAAGTTIFGMLPLLPDAFFASMAVTIMGGLAFASVLTLLAVPVLYAILFRIRRPNAASAREIPSGATT